MKDKRLKQLALNIKAERVRKNISQAQLAEAINISERSMSQIEQAKQTPSVFIIFDIANALEIPIEELFRGIPKRTDGK